MILMFEKKIGEVSFAKKNRIKLKNTFNVIIIFAISNFVQILF